MNYEWTIWGTLMELRFVAIHRRTLYEAMVDCACLNGGANGVTYSVALT